MGTEPQTMRRKFSVLKEVVSLARGTLHNAQLTLPK